MAVTSRLVVHHICYSMTRGASHVPHAPRKLSNLPEKLFLRGDLRRIIVTNALRAPPSTHSVPRTLRLTTNGHGLVHPVGKVFFCSQSAEQQEQSTEPFSYPGSGFAELGITQDKLLQPGDPDTYTVRIRDVMPVGYFVDMPNGREGYLPANDLGFSGGIERLRTIFQVGQPVVVRITFRGPSGRELLSIRKYDPERPPVEPPRIARSSGSRKHKFRHMRQNS